MKMTSSYRVPSVYNKSIKIAKGRENMLSRTLHRLGIKAQILEKKNILLCTSTFNYFS